MLYFRLNVEDEWPDLVYGSTNVPVTLTSLTWLTLTINDVSCSSTRAAINCMLPFLVLLLQSVYDGYLFDDDLLLRGNS
ncbi:hypothetical protein GGH92_001364 [Coemansia sp. RSA 2673]|nr:hypothetical protein GGH13_005661 [Coemansia sp. S155-1]KAJ2352260.1 hypothetical protein GGH92_001364 [Coemansia sp. RSA 2673]KAJ2423160.1 hypothetical protein GGF41_003248 [Coemansia sp. RSA 2531]